jgi:hypothetical protein
MSPEFAPTRTPTNAPGFLVSRQQPLRHTGPLGMLEPQPIRVTVRSMNQEISMLGRIVAVTPAIGGLTASNAAFAQRD